MKHVLPLVKVPVSLISFIIVGLAILAFSGAPFAPVFLGIAISVGITGISLEIIGALHAYPTALHVKIEKLKKQQDDVWNLLATKPDDSAQMEYVKRANAEFDRKIEELYKEIEIQKTVTAQKAAKKKAAKLQKVADKKHKKAQKLLRSAGINVSLPTEVLPAPPEPEQSKLREPRS